MVHKFMLIWLPRKTSFQKSAKNKEIQVKLKRYGDKFGSSYVNVKVESKYADYGADYEIANYYDQSKRNFAFTKTNLSRYNCFEHKG